jgi:uncharacterized protein YndB with AHSA1/START domain
VPPVTKAVLFGILKGLSCPLLDLGRVAIPGNASVAKIARRRRPSYRRGSGENQMFSLSTRVHVEGLSGREITDFLSTCDDEFFQCWWPGTHFHLHTIRGTPGTIGSHVLLDEMVGDRRVRMTCELVSLVPGQELVWQLRWPLLRLPVKLTLSLQDDDTGVQIEQSVQAGFSGAGEILDPLFKLFFQESLARAKDEHVRMEFPKLRDFLHQDAR